ncbi:MAG: hypothetical protein SFV22_17550 [Saprospiraceae bacterium]|nr:hypothetical protein [Saprospiraceae bacterium]
MQNLRRWTAYGGRPTVDGSTDFSPSGAAAFMPIMSKKRPTVDGLR